MEDFIGLLGVSGFLVFMLSSLVLIGLSLKYNHLLKYMIASLALASLCLGFVIANLDVLNRLANLLSGNNAYASTASQNKNETEKQEKLPNQVESDEQLAFKQKVEQDLERVKTEIEKSNAPSPQVELAKQEAKSPPKNEEVKKPNQQEPPKKQVASSEKQSTSPQSKSNNITQDADGTFIIKRGQELKVDEVNLTNNMNFKMVIFSKTSIGVQVDGVVTSVDGKGNPVVTKTSKPFFSPVQHSPNAEVIVDPSYAGGLSFLSGDGGTFDVIIRAAPKAKTGEYMAYVNFQWARESSIKSKYTLTDKEYKFRIVD